MDKILRQALIDYLNNPHTHKSLLEAVEDFPEGKINEKPAGAPYSFWEQLEHIRICQWDMLDFMVNPGYKEMEWPKEYWPKPGERAGMKQWKESIMKFEQDYESLKKIIENSDNGLFAKIPHGSGQTIFREVLQIIDHNSYHIGQFVLMRKLIDE